MLKGNLEKIAYNFRCHSKRLGYWHLFLITFETLHMFQNDTVSLEVNHIISGFFKIEHGTFNLGYCYSKKDNANLF